MDVMKHVSSRTSRLNSEHRGTLIDHLVTVRILSVEEQVSVTISSGQTKTDDGVNHSGNK